MQMKLNNMPLPWNVSNETSFLCLSVIFIEKIKCFQRKNYTDIYVAREKKISTNKIRRRFHYTLNIKSENGHSSKQIYSFNDR